MPRHVVLEYLELYYVDANRQSSTCPTMSNISSMKLQLMNCYELEKNRAAAAVSNCPLAWDWPASLQLH